MNLKDGARRKLDTSAIPEELREFIPMVEKWAFAKQAEQDAFAMDMVNKAPDEAEQAARERERMRVPVASWGSRLTGGLPVRMAQLADNSSHPYWAFVDALAVLDQVELDGGISAETAERTRLEQLKIRFGDVAELAEEAFRAKNYRRYVELMSPYEELLSKSQTAKLTLASRKL